MFLEWDQDFSLSRLVLLLGCVILQFTYSVTFSTFVVVATTMVASGFNIGCCRLEGVPHWWSHNKGRKVGIKFDSLPLPMCASHGQFVNALSFQVLLLPSQVASFRVMPIQKFRLFIDLSILQCDTSPVHKYTSFNNYQPSKPSNLECEL